ncbi:hypothetical protein EJ05DRAFT_507998 [Pseudovirgaria hyperparasitica]|uniref:Uncharacterized protein n=1 Tax=Pseudovirgaria hyperparasitica TaxID=470096 RepID=A0A6A6WD30_9PEZI|nr:uncharacterized protein EJ05DRAFT_507998 [Pseudovirgaria hyperparasitica]KAF2760742.1 hypothetical protein EJ05DRAFT_507998 [Pseudovirgaria hyperparasitica]
MRSIAAGRGKAVTGLRPQVSSDHIWISDELLADTFAHFTLRNRPTKRYGSNVPGPLEARRRLDKRRHTSVASYGPSAPPPPSPGLLSWLLTPPKRSHTWSYEPPNLSRPSGQAPICEVSHSHIGDGHRDSVTCGDIFSKYTDNKYAHTFDITCPHAHSEDVRRPDIQSENIPSNDKFSNKLLHDDTKSVDVHKHDTRSDGSYKDDTQSEDIQSPISTVDSSCLLHPPIALERKRPGVQAATSRPVTPPSTNTWKTPDELADRCIAEAVEEMKEVDPSLPLLIPRLLKPTFIMLQNIHEISMSRFDRRSSKSRTEGVLYQKEQRTLTVEYRKLYSRAWQRICSEMSAKDSSLSRHSVACVKLVMDIMHEESWYLHSKEQLEREFATHHATSEALIVRALRPIKSKYFHFERRVDLISQLLLDCPQGTALAEQVTLRLARAYEQEESRTEKRYLRQNLLNFEKMLRTSAENQDTHTIDPRDTPDTQETMRAVSATRKMMLSELQAVDSSVLKEMLEGELLVAGTTTKKGTLLRWLTLLHRYDRTLRRLRSNTKTQDLQRRVDWDHLIPFLSNVPHEHMLKIFRMRGNTSCVNRYLRTRYILPHSGGHQDLGKSRDQDLDPFKESNINATGVAQQSHAMRRPLVIDMSTLSTFMLDLLQRRADSDVVQDAWIACLDIIYRMWGSTALIQFVRDVRSCAHPFPRLLFSQGVMERIMQLLKHQATRARKSQDPTEALRIKKLTNLYMFPDLFDKRLQPVSSRIIEDGSMPATRLVRNMGHGRKSDSKWISDPQVANYLTLSPAFIEHMNNMAYAIATSPAYRPTQAWRGVKCIYFFLHIRRAPIRPKFTRALVMAGVTRFFLDNRWVNRAQFAWIRHIVAKVEGEDVAMDLEDLWYEWRGRLIAMAAQAYKSHGIEGMANVTIARQLGLTDPKRRWNGAIYHKPEATALVVKTPDSEFDVRKRGFEDV